MGSFAKYFIRLLTPGRLYFFYSKLRFPNNDIDYRKFFIAKHLLKKGGSAIDGGAHIGYFTRTLAEIVKKEEQIWSFEPNPYVFKLLKKYAKYQKNVIPMPYALTNQKVQRCSFRVSPYSLAMDSTLEMNQNNSSQKKIEVETMQLDELLNCGIREVKLIKLDVEGHELKVLEGGEQLIIKFHPWIIFEYSNNAVRNDSAVLSYLDEKGYFCMDLATLSFLSPTCRIDLTDGVAIPKSERESALKFLDSLHYF